MENEIKPKNCIICKKEVPCLCFELDADEYGTAYFCSKVCVKEFEEEHSIDVEAIHTIDCKIKGNYEKEWVDELQKRMQDYRRLFEEFHQKNKVAQKQIKDFREGIKSSIECFKENFKRYDIPKGKNLVLKMIDEAFAEVTKKES